MERELSSARIEAALEAVGVAPGRLVYVSADLRRPGMVAGARDAGAFAGAYLEAFRRLLGPKGTLVVPTFTPQVLRTSTDFILESTPALTGLFAAHVRQTPRALQQPRAQGWGKRLAAGVGRAQHALEPLAAFGDIAPDVPEPAQHRTHPRGAAQRATAQRKLKRGAQVVVLGRQPVEPKLLVGAF